MLDSSLDDNIWYLWSTAVTIDTRKSIDTLLNLYNSFRHDLDPFPNHPCIYNTPRDDVINLRGFLRVDTIKDQRSKNQELINYKLTTEK